MKLTVYSNDCATCGKNKLQLAILQKAAWNRHDVELKSVNIRNDALAKNRYHELRHHLTNRHGDLDALVATDEGSVFWLKDVTQALVETILT